MALEVLQEIVVKTVYPVAQVQQDILDLKAKQVFRVLQVSRKCFLYSIHCVSSLGMAGLLGPNGFPGVSGAPGPKGLPVKKTYWVVSNYDLFIFI